MRLSSITGSEWRSGNPFWTGIPKTLLFGENMTDIFGLKAAIAPFVGGTDIAGIILGSALTVAFVVALSWAISGGKSSRQSNMVMLISAGIAVGIATLLEWFPVWIPIFIVVIAVFALVGPFSNRSSA